MNCRSLACVIPSQVGSTVSRPALRGVGQHGNGDNARRPCQFKKRSKRHVLDTVRLDCVLQCVKLDE